mmetsp:Transcript_17225/g.30372  ORF Transcript_17225/g.30372 Transcript_17225/m.30372 type:complete len:159 (+) Transcript_17225:183-659(+)
MEHSGPPGPEKVATAEARGKPIPSVADLRAELFEQLQQLKRTTLFYRERVSHVTADLSKEQSLYEQLKQRYEAQSEKFQQLQSEKVLWKSNVELKREQVELLKQELEVVTAEWRKARSNELAIKQLEKNNQYLERLVITVAFSIPMAVIAEKQFRSRL